MRGEFVSHTVYAGAYSPLPINITTITKNDTVFLNSNETPSHSHNQTLQQMWSPFMASHFSDSVGGASAAMNFSSFKRNTTRLNDLIPPTTSLLPSTQSASTHNSLSTSSTVQSNNSLPRRPIHCNSLTHGFTSNNPTFTRLTSPGNSSNDENSDSD
ncbi:hypothetical protein RYX36_012308 [Vicia faba]